MTYYFIAQLISLLYAVENFSLKIFGGGRDKGDGFVEISVEILPLGLNLLETLLYEYIFEFLYNEFKTLYACLCISTLFHVF